MKNNGHMVSRMQPAPIPHADAEGSGTHAASTASFDTTEAILRLLLGGLMLGAEEFRTRVQRWEATARLKVPLQAADELPQNATVPEMIRRTATGMLFVGEARARRGFSKLTAGLARMYLGAEYLFTTTVEPIVRRTPLDGVLGRFDETMFTLLTTLDSWSARGQMEERLSREVAQEAVSRLTDELFDYVAHNPEVRELIEQQGASLAEETLDGARERMAAVDSHVERLAHRLLHRQGKDLPAELDAVNGAAPPAEVGS